MVISLVQSRISNNVVAIFCNGMFVPKRGGTLAIFMFTGWTLEIFMVLWVTSGQYLCIVT